MRPVANLASGAGDEGGHTVHNSILGSQVAPATNLLKLEAKGVLHSPLTYRASPPDMLAGQGAL